MTGSWLSVAAAFGVVALNGFFVATEFALVKVRPTRLDELARRGSAAARRAKRLVEHLDEYLSATQLGITLASLALGWIGEPAFAHLIEPLGTRAGLAPTTREAIAAALSFLLITFLHIVFGELAPKSLAIQRSEGTALVVSAPMRWFRLLFYPAIWALNGVASATLRVLGLRPPSESEAIHTEEELRLIVASMRSSQGGSRERLDLVARTLRLPERVARDLMVSRQDTVYFRLDQTPEERREVAKKAGHSHPAASGRPVPGGSPHAGGRLRPPLRHPDRGGLGGERRRPGDREAPPDPRGRRPAGARLRPADRGGDGRPEDRVAAGRAQRRRVSGPRPPPPSDCSAVVTRPSRGPATKHAP